jgi:hypothetical protein
LVLETLLMLAAIAGDLVTQSEIASHDALANVVAALEKPAMFMDWKPYFAMFMD